MDHSPLIIEIRSLTKRFGDRAAVADLDLAVPRGNAFGFLGHNGAGKTTLIRLLLGLTQPDSGTIMIAGRRVGENRQEVLSGVGAIIEEPHFHGHLTGQENLEIVAAVRGPQAYPRIEPAIARVGLRNRADDRVRTYSQGMRQRLGIARCLLADPELLILDEPMNGLDPGGIRQFRQLIADLVAEGRTVFLSSHLLAEIEKTCSAVAVIDQGRLVWQGPIGAIGEIAGGHRHYDIDCDNPSVAVDLLSSEAAALQVTASPGGIRVTVADARAVTVLNARLVGAGIAVSGVSPVRVSLEDRFLELTTRVGGRRP
jgi:ABC-2 type transport system ATP-binding protein